MTDIRITRHDGPAGWAEIGFYRGHRILAVLTRPITGARWTLYPADNTRRRFTTFKAAMAAARALTQET
jgi:hypothetical protein